jgi:hypothetical protein
MDRPHDLGGRMNFGPPYYEHWLTAAATMAVESGIVSTAGVEKRARGAFALARPVRVGPLDDIGTGPTKFAVGCGTTAPSACRTWRRTAVRARRRACIPCGSTRVRSGVTHRHGPRSSPICRTATWRRHEHRTRAGRAARALHNVVVCTLCSCYPWAPMDPALLRTRPASAAQG